MVSSDVERFYPMALFSHAFLSVPILVPIVIGLLSMYVGWVALLGVAILCVLIPIQIYMGKAFGTIRGRTAKLTDNRVKRTSQMISANRIMKMYAPSTKLLLLGMAVIVWWRGGTSTWILGIYPCTNKPI